MPQTLARVLPSSRAGTALFAGSLTLGVVSLAGADPAVPTTGIAAVIFFTLSGLGLVIERVYQGRKSSNEVELKRAKEDVAEMAAEALAREQKFEATQRELERRLESLLAEERRRYEAMLAEERRRLVAENNRAWKRVSDLENLVTGRPPGTGDFPTLKTEDAP